MRLHFFRIVKTICEDRLKQYGYFPPLESIINQLDYLINLEIDKDTDRSKLAKINIGLITAREIEPLDMSLADKLYEVVNEIDKMKSSR